MLTKKKVVSALGLLAWIGLAGSASAQTWSYASFSEANAGTYANSYSYTQSGVKLTVTGYSTTGTSGAIQTANIGNYGAGSGFGIRNQIETLTVTAPQHAMDNLNHTDFLALSFTNAAGSAAVSVNVTQIASGWSTSDSDVSLLYWSKSGAPTIAGGSISTLLTAGWKLVNNYADLPPDQSIATGSSASSSWWLISSYNSAWGTGSNTANLSDGNDYIKVLSSVTATVVPDTVPEPTSLALFAVAAAGLYAKRRKSA